MALHKLLQLQLQKIYGKAFDPANIDKQTKELIELTHQAYCDFDRKQGVIEHALEVNAQELSKRNEEIKKSRDLLHSVTESIPNAIFYKNMEGHFIGCNAVFESFTGKKLYEIIHRSNTLLNHEDAAAIEQMETEVISDKKPRVRTLWMHHRQKGKTLYHLLLTPLFHTKNEITGIVGIMNDITNEHRMQTEIKKKEAQLLEQSRFVAMGEMLSMIAHQWRQPISAISSAAINVNLLQELNSLEDDTLKEQMHFIQNECQQMSHTINDFMDFSKPEKKRELFSLDDSIKRVKIMTYPQLKNRSIAWQSDVPSDISLYGVKNEFEHVLLNLITNARDALESSNVSNKCITFKGCQNASETLLTVSDNAGGVPEDIIEKIFDPYFSTKPKGKGTGIGLYMTRAILERHFNGNIEVKNSPEGAEFILTLPLNV